MPQTSVRKPLRDVSNSHGRFSKSSATAKKKDKEPHKLRLQKEEEDDEPRDHQNDDALDRLLLVQSDLSALVHQIDELVVEAFKCKETETKEVESFTNFVSEMLSSLKPWVPRLRKAVSASEVENVEEIESPQGSLISPSPLVSWRAADCTIKRGRHLFKLTPLPISKSLSSKPPISSKPSLFEITTSTDRMPLFRATFGDDDLLELGATKPTTSKPSGSIAAETESNLGSGFVSTPILSKTAAVVNVTTPCLKMSPPKSCVLLEPISESSPKGHHAVHKSTPFPFGFTNCGDSSGSEASEDLAFRYPELLALQQGYKPGVGKKNVEASPDWCMSPPKTCVLLEPPDEKSLDNAATDCQLPIPCGFLYKQMNFSVSKENDGHQELVGGSFALIESTPTWREAESVVRTGKLPGENTLKRELWTKFEAASTTGLRFNDSVTHKGFLDRLDEVCDGDD